MDDFYAARARITADASLDGFLTAMHTFNSKWFSLGRAPAVMPPPQGHPVRMQAGSSQAGRDFGARWAEVIFTAQPLLELAREFHADINARAANKGRCGAVRILPGLMPFIASSRSEAQAAIEARSQGRGDVAKQLTEFLCIDITTLPPDIPIPLELLPPHGTTNGMRGRADMMLDIVRRYRLTPRQVLAQNAHLIFAGTPAETADLICQWFEEQACDGFTLMWPAPESCLLFTTQVIPILQRRGVYRTSYEGPTLRDHFRLKRPVARPVCQDAVSS